MCIHVLLIDSVLLTSTAAVAATTEPLVNDMKQLRVNLYATFIRDRLIHQLFARYHLQHLMIQFMGKLHQCPVNVNVK
jgi:hypothetical protein